MPCASPTSSLPTAAEEIWRYSRIEDLDLTPLPARPWRRPRSRAAATSSSARADARPSVVDAADPDVFAELNAAFARTVVVRVPQGPRRPPSRSSSPSHVDGAGTAVFPRLVIDAGDDSEVTVVERFTSAGRRRRPRRPGRCRSAPARRRGSATSASTSSPTRPGRSATSRPSATATRRTTLATVALGGHYARVRTEARLVGAGGSTRQVALYFAGGQQMHDFRTIQDHDAPHTTSDLLFKGAVQDESRSVYTGLIKIRKHARGTAAFQTNRNLTLSEGAWAESVPNLEIETNDVRCSHASTVGPIDAEQRFYLESRGIPTQIAERLIVLGFFDEVLDQLPVGPLAERAAPAGLGQARPRAHAHRGGLTWRRHARDDRPRRPRAGHGAPHRRSAACPIAVVRIDDDVYAIGDSCSHANVSLSEGEVWCDEREIECPKHGSTFSLDDRRAADAAGDPAGAGVPHRGRRRHGHRRTSTEVRRDDAEDRGPAGRRRRARDPARHRPHRVERRGPRGDGPERRRQEHALGDRHGQARLRGARRLGHARRRRRAGACRRGSAPPPACTS